MAYLPKRLRKQLAAEQGGICPWCEMPLPDDCADTSLDHIIPRSRGGPDEPWNRQVLHAKCNGPRGKGSRLTAEAIELAAEHGIVLHEPLPTAWPGSSVPLGSGKPNPYRVARENGTAEPLEPPVPSPPPAPPEPPPHRVTVRKVYEVDCETCGGVIAGERSYVDAMAARRDHIERCRREDKPAA